jgi:hypothetical protein
MQITCQVVPSGIRKRRAGRKESRDGKASTPFDGRLIALLV